MVSYLQQILTLNNDNGEDAQNTGLDYKAMDEARSQVEETKSSLIKKLHGERTKRIVAQQKQLLPIYSNTPAKLCGRKVKQRCFEDGVVEWFPATVLEIKMLPQDPLKVEYNLHYDAFPDDVWHFPLLKDLQKGDLIILDE